MREEPLALTERQARELEYHRKHAREHSQEHQKVSFDCLDPARRRWWNAYWEVFRFIRSLDMHGKRWLVVGCGFGEDALLLAKLGAEVYAFDLSAEQLAVGERLSEAYGLPVRFEQMPAEHMRYEDNFFDGVLVIDILHHCAVPEVLAEIRRVARPGAHVIVDEIYTHSYLQRVRESGLVARYLYPIWSRLLYGNSPYITEDERKLNERDLDGIVAAFRPDKVDFFCAIVKRIIPERVLWVSKADRLLLLLLPALGRLVAGRFVLIGSAR